MDAKTIEYKYLFKFLDDKEAKFKILLKSDNLEIITKEKETYPEWAKLDFHKCPCCMLKSEENTYCPIAKNMVDIVELSKGLPSYEELKVFVSTKQRMYMKKTSLQSAISSLIGIYMVTSACPTLEKLKPMVRYHLPFANLEETVYRAMSMYLVSQFFTYKETGKGDWDLKGLVSLYDNVEILNKSFSERLKSLNSKDSSINAVVILNTFANYVKFSISGDMLKKIKKDFISYL